MEPRTQYHRYRKQHRRANVFAVLGVSLLMASATLFFVAGVKDIGFVLPFTFAGVGFVFCLVASTLYELSKHEFVDITGMSPDKFRRELDREKRRQRRI